MRSVTKRLLPIPKQTYGTDLTRVLNFSDGVFAIAITILAFTLHVPPKGAIEMSAYLFSIWREIALFATSFFVIAIYWKAHNRLFRHIERYDDNLLWLNILFLFCVSLLPFLTQLAQEYKGDVNATFVYGTGLAITGLVLSGLWKYATHKHRLVSIDMDDRVIHYNSVRTAFGPVLFLLTLPLIYVNLLLAKILWAAIIIVYIFFEHFYHRARSEQ